MYIYACIYIYIYIYICIYSSCEKWKLSLQEIYQL